MQIAMALVASRNMYIVSKLGAMGYSARHFKLTVRERISVDVEEWNNRVNSH